MESRSVVLIVVGSAFLIAALAALPLVGLNLRLQEGRAPEGGRLLGGAAWLVDSHCNVLPTLCLDVDLFKTQSI